MHKHAKIFEKLFAKQITYTAIAKHCGVTLAATRRWHKPTKWVGKVYDPVGIPYKHFPAIVSLAKSHGIDLTLDDFKQIEIEQIDKIFNDFK